MPTFFFMKNGEKVTKRPRFKTREVTCFPFFHYFFDVFTIPKLHEDTLTIEKVSGVTDGPSITISLAKLSSSFMGLAVSFFIFYVRVAISIFHAKLSGVSIFWKVGENLD